MSFLAGRLVRQPRLKVILEKIATWVLPFVLIVIGIMIFLDEPREVFLEET
jgi:cadmium resistance protein CadD (predicted permease)